jgi:hypothetical protein
MGFVEFSLAEVITAKDQTLKKKWSFPSMPFTNSYLYILSEELKTNAN